MVYYFHFVIQKIHLVNTTQRVNNIDYEQKENVAVVVLDLRDKNFTYLGFTKFEIHLKKAKGVKFVEN